MKIAIVSDDHVLVSAHFGRGLFYEIYDIDANKVTGHTTIERAFPTVAEPNLAQASHQHKHDHNAMIQPIEDCVALISGGMGRGAYYSLQENDIQPIITDLPKIDQVLEAYFNGTLRDHPEKLH